MKIHGVTDTGLVRKMNQDTFETVSLSDSMLFACVCDGMGGPGGGEIASSLASKTFSIRFSTVLASGCSLASIPAAVEEILADINVQIQKIADGDVIYTGMGTTFVAAIVMGKKALVVNIGDSRVYHISENSIRQITKDHSMVQQLLDEGKITPEEFKTHPKKNIITKALGAFEYIIPDWFEFTLKEDSKIVLCSDGLTNYVDDNEILFELTNATDPDDALKQLIGIAYSRGASDNITIVSISQ